MILRRRSLCISKPLGFAVAAALALWPARSAPAADAGAVLQRYLAATGGRAAWEKERTLRARMTLSAFGLAGTSEHWSARPDRSASATRIGPLTIRDGTLGGRAWRVDQNGKLRWLDGRELEDARSSAYFDLEMWLAPGRGGGKVAHAGLETEDGGRFDVLEITPPVGKPRRLYFDRATGLLSRMIQPGDAQPIETRFSGYERLAGRLRPRDLQTRIHGAPANDVRARIDTMWVGVEADSALFLPPRLDARDFRFLGGGSPAVIPIEYAARHVWVKVSVNGARPQDFLLDTGASVTVLDSIFAAQLGLAAEGELQAAGAGAAGKMTLARISSLRVEGAGGAGVEVTDQNVLVASLNRYVAPYFWRDVAGVLGYDFISRFVMTVDFQGRKLVLEDAEPFSPAGKGTPLAINFVAGVPVVRAKVDEVYEGDFRLDVGSGGSVDLHAPFVKQHGLEEKTGRKLPGTGGGFGGTFERLTTRMKSFTVGPYTVKEPLVGLSRATTGALASEDYAGNVGNRILERFTCTFDYGRKTLYLEPNARFGERAESVRFGAQMLKTGDRIRIASVIPGSPAAEAGLAAGDEVLSIAGRPAVSYTPDELESLLEQQPDGTGVAIEFTRSGEKRQVEARLRAML